MHGTGTTDAVKLTDPTTGTQASVRGKVDHGITAVHDAQISERLDTIAAKLDELLWLLRTALNT